MVIYDQVLSERLLQFNDVCRCQLVIADDVGFAKALNRVLFGNINGVGVAYILDIVHERLPLYILTCAHIEQRLVPNPQRFEGLEEDKITWYSNVIACKPLEGLGLEEDKITWYSNQRSRPQSQCGLEENKIAWHSNQHSPQLVNRVGLAEDKITWFSNLTDGQSMPTPGLEGEEITGFSSLYHAPKFLVRDLKGNSITEFPNAPDWQAAGR